MRNRIVRDKLIDLLLVKLDKKRDIFFEDKEEEKEQLRLEIINIIERLLEIL